MSHTIQHQKQGISKAGGGGRQDPAPHAPLLHWIVKITWLYCTLSLVVHVNIQCDAIRSDQFEIWHFSLAYNLWPTRLNKFWKINNFCLTLIQKSKSCFQIKIRSLVQKLFFRSASNFKKWPRQPNQSVMAEYGREGCVELSSHCAQSLHICPKGNAQISYYWW